jgi:putative ABC transport system permease protein
VFHNYLAVALRNIIRHKLYSLINIAGLAVGLACIIFVSLFIRDELSYDTWVPGTRNLYRVEKIAHPPGRAPLEMAGGPFPFAAVMRDENPEVVGMTRLNYFTITLFAGDRLFREHVAEVEPNFFSIIRLPLVKGDPAAILREPDSIVLSESAALKYFGTTDAIGKLVKTAANCEPSDGDCQSRLVPLKVTGIMRDIPHNSHLDGDVFIPNTSVVDRIGQHVKQSWFYNATFSYVVLAPGARPEAVVAKMAPLFDHFIPSEQIDHQKGSQRYAIHLTPFDEVHLTSGRWSGNEKPSGSLITLYGVGLVGVLILFVACFNFMNLATAQASLRAREIALRKTLGAHRGQLVVQFLGEAVVTALLSLIAALALAEILQPAFGRLLGHAIAIHYDPAWLSLLVLVALSAGLLSGIYPALVLSGFRPSTILRTGNTGRTGAGHLQMFLVVLQFAVSIGLGIVVIVVFSQIRFARGIDLGFRKDNTVVIVGNDLLTVGGQDSFVQRLKSNPGILDVAMIDTPPFNGSYTLAGLRVPGRPELVSLYRRVMGINAAQFLGMRLVAGRLLSDKRAQDQFDAKDTTQKSSNNGHNILVDEAAAASLGFSPQQAVGKSLLLKNNRLQIVGVLATVKFDGAREPAKPAYYVYDPQYPAYAMIRIRPDAVPQTLPFIDRTWRDFAPTRPVWRYFLSDVFGNLYRSEERQGDIFGVFVGIAIFIACLGLFGLAAFTAGRRTQEIGIRKVFGARTRDVAILLLWQFSIPVLIANLIAWPIAWYYLHDWLQGFAYRITLSPLYFAAAGFAALVIAWTTILAHALRIARANPIHALRTE